MNEIILFLFGLVTGGFIGIMVMCMLQIKRINDYENLLIGKDNESDVE